MKYVMNRSSTGPLVCSSVRREIWITPAIFEICLTGDRVGRLIDVVIGWGGELKYEEETREMRTKKSDKKISTEGTIWEGYAWWVIDIITDNSEICL
jgi:hypothetical protein